MLTIELYAEIYFSLAAELNRAEEFTDSDIILYSENKKIHKLFYQNYLKLNQFNPEVLKSLLAISIKKFPNRKYFFKNLLKLKWIKNITLRYKNSY